MAIKKSELYSSLWKSCDELRGGMDASQYKDYVLVLLFVKYVSDKAASQKGYLLDVPQGRQLRRHGRAQGRQGNRRQDEQDHRQARRGQRPQGRDRRRRLQRCGQARQGQGDGGPPLQPRRHLRQSGARLPQQPRRGRRPARRRLRIPDAALRHRVGQEQGAVLHPGGSLPHHGEGHRRRQRQASRPDHPRSHLRLGLAAAQGARRSQGPHRPRPRALRAGDGQRHRRAGADEHDPARLPHGGDLAGQHARQPPLQGPRRRGSRRSTSSSPIRPSRPRRGATASIPSATSSSASSSAFRPRRTATTPSCCTSSLASRAPAKARSFSRTACCSAAAPRRPSAARSSSAAISRASSACRNLFYGTGIPACIIVLDKENAPPARASS